MSIKYSDKNLAFVYLASLFVAVLYPIIWVLICKIVLEFLLLHYKNKRLICTVKHILEIFPEGVVIRTNIFNKKL